MLILSEVDSVTFDEDNFFFSFFSKMMVVGEDVAFFKEGKFWGTVCSHSQLSTNCKCGKFLPVLSFVEEFDTVYPSANMVFELLLKEKFLSFCRASHCNLQLPGSLLLSHMFSHMWGQLYG